MNREKKIERLFEQLLAKDTFIALDFRTICNLGAEIEPTYELALQAIRENKNLDYSLIYGNDCPEDGEESTPDVIIPFID